jgi:hypothetical protein
MPHIPLPSPYGLAPLRDSRAEFVVRASQLAPCFGTGSADNSARPATQQRLVSGGWSSRNEPPGENGSDARCSSARNPPFLPLFRHRLKCQLNKCQLDLDERRKAEEISAR